MNENLQGPLKKLATALHRAIARSEDVGEALRALKGEGFQAHLVLEITVALSRLALEAEAALDDDDALVLEPTLDEDQDLVDDVDEEVEAALASAGEADDDVEADAPLDGEITLGVSPLRIGPDDREFLRSIRIRVDE